MGHIVLGPAPSCTAALEAIWAHPPDVAFIDTELGPETCEVVVNEWRALGIPMIITSGLPAHELKDYCMGLPYMGKPFAPLHVNAALASLAA